MSFNPNAKAPSTEFNLIPNGIHAARCARIIEIGKQHSPRYDRITETGETIPSISDKAVIVFSLSNTTFEYEGLGEKQAFISNRYGVTKSTNDRSTMKQYAKALDPKGVASSLKDFLTKPCQVSIIHVHKDGKVFANLDSVAPILPGLQIPELDTDPFMFEWDNPNPAYWDLIPEHTKSLILGAYNFKGSRVEKMLNDMSAHEPQI
jgi:hypothetical protein